MIIQTNMCIRDGLKCKLDTFNIFMFTSNKVLVPLNNTILVKFRKTSNFKIPWRLQQKIYMVLQVLKINPLSQVSRLIETKYAPACAICNDSSVFWCEQSSRACPDEFESGCFFVSKFAVRASSLWNINQIKSN